MHPTRSTRFSVPLLWILAVLQFPGLAVSAQITNGLHYTTANGTVTIVGYDCGTSKTLHIPSTINGMPVVSIGDMAFRWCTNLTSVAIPYGVTNLGPQAFRGCSGLLGLNIPDTVVSVGDAAFQGCSTLAYITIPNSTKSIPSNAFNGCRALTQIQIPTNVSSIGYSAFAGCVGLTNITIPNSVKTISNHAFSGSGINTLIIGNAVATIFDPDLTTCTNLTSVYFRGDSPVIDNFFPPKDVLQLNADTTVYYNPLARGWAGFPISGAGKLSPYPAGTRFAAIASSLILNGYVVGVQISDSGYGYTTPPNVVISGGGGSGATATATINAFGMVTDIKVVNPGQGYTSAPTVEINEATVAQSPERATATAILVNGFVIAINLTKKGYGYTAAPNVAIVGGGGTGATATCVLDAAGSIAAINIQNPGFGYSSVPAVIVDPPLIAASANANTINGFVVGANVVQGGFGYATPPVVRFVGGGGFGATATTTIDTNGTVTAINMFNVGSGYTTAPTVLIAPPIVPAPTASASMVHTLVFAGLNNLLRYDLQQSTDSGVFQSTGIAVTPQNGVFTTTSDLQIQGIFSEHFTETVSFRLVAQPVPTAATASVQVLNGFVVGVKVLNGGSGYTMVPTVAIADSTGSGAVVTATVNNGTVVAFIVTNSGHGYSTAATASVGAPPVASITPVSAPTLRIGVTNLLQNFSYQLQTSTNLPALGNSGAAFTATNTWQYLYVPMHSSSGFSRVQFVQ